MKTQKNLPPTLHTQKTTNPKHFFYVGKKLDPRLCLSKKVAFPPLTDRPHQKHIINSGASKK